MTLEEYVIAGCPKSGKSVSLTVLPVNFEAHTPEQIDADVENIVTVLTKSVPSGTVLKVFQRLRSELAMFGAEGTIQHDRVTIDI